MVRKEDSAFVIYEIHKCSEKTMGPGYPECAKPDEIEAWINSKKATFKLISSKIDLTEMEERAVSFEELYLTQVPLKSGLYTDDGHRFRFNEFLRIDYWWSGYKSIDIFYDYMFYSHDVYEVP